MEHVERLDAPHEISQVGEDPVFEQATRRSLALDNGGSDNCGVAREQLTTADDGHEQPKRQTFKKEVGCFGGVAYAVTMWEDVDYAKGSIEQR